MSCQSKQNHEHPFSQQMDSVQVTDRGDCIEDAFDEQSLSPESSVAYDVFGEPQEFPRMGDEYQVEIPLLISGSEYLWLTKNPAERPHDFLVGLAVPMMWISDEFEYIKNESKEAFGGSTEVFNKDESRGTECLRETHIFWEADKLEPKAEPTNSTLDNGINLIESTNVAKQHEMKIEFHDMGRGKDYRPVPGSLGDLWSDTEEASFILGLYIFGKNLALVKRFIGTKKMGDILSFYYGKFYRSDRYHRWAECRKLRSRRCICGQRIFTGLRQQEFLSRLLSRVSEECQNTLMEVSKAFGEGRMLLEEYVFTLKASVGLNALVEAVGIGKGKQDLTGIMEPLKSTQVFPVHPEIPTGKACSTLTTLEIANFLTGGFRLSKNRSNDLFWEAVWPRLLARGWHSEQPNSNGCATGSKHSLVFLIPGIKKFSRRKLVKGNDYFDSISDVLSKVASDPGLLELEIGVDNDYRSKEENGRTDETKLDKEDFPDQQRHCYLKPRTPNAMTFTVVDTSLANGKATKVRELRSLPSGVMNTLASGSDSEEDDEDDSEEPTDKSDSADTLYSDRDKPRAMNNNFNPGSSFNGTGLENNASNEVFQVNGHDHTNLPANISCDQKTIMCSDTQPRKGKKCQLSQRMGPDNKDHLPTIAKRHRKLNAFGRSETNLSKLNNLGGDPLNPEKASGFAKNPDFSEKVVSKMDMSQEKKLSASLSKGSISISSEGILGGTCFAAEDHHEGPQPRTLIDLNLPIPPDVEADEPFMTETKERKHDQMSNEPYNPNEVKPSEYVANSEQQPNINNRRQSTRSRPLTTKALEALAFGYLDPKQKRKSRDASSRETSMLRPSRRARGKVRATENFGNSMVDFKVEEMANGMCQNNSEMLTKLQV
ncbi:uncharacterized protein LOC112015887 isoform X1 [Quercus suber]